MIGIGVVEPDRGTVNVRGLPVAAYRLANGNAVVDMYEQEVLSDQVRRNLSEKLRKIPVPRGRDTPPESWSRSRPPTLLASVCLVTTRTESGSSGT